MFPNRINRRKLAIDEKQFVNHKNKVCIKQLLAVLPIISLKRLPLVLSALLLLHLFTCLADYNSGLNSNAVLAEGSNQWNEVEPSRKSIILEMLIDQTKGNYEKIRTWKCVYAFHIEQILPAQGFAKSSRIKLDPSYSRFIIQEFKYHMRTVVDMESDSIFREKENIEMRFLNQDTRKVIEIPNLTTPDERSVVNAEHYITFRPKTIWPRFVNLPDHPKAQQKKSAFRKSADSAEKMGFGLLDPRDFFGANQHRKIWEELNVVLKALKGEYGEEKKDSVNKDLQVYSERSQAETKYKLVRKIYFGVDYILYSTVIFSSKTGFNPISYIWSKDQSGLETWNIVKWEWKLYDGIYLPAMEYHKNHQKGNNTKTYERTAKLQQCVLNDPIDAEQFTYKGLGLKEGDMIVDEIENAMYLLKDNKPDKLANFNEKYIPPDEIGMRTFRLWLTAGGILAIGLFLFFSIRRRKNSI